MTQPTAAKRRVFVSYHHRADQGWFDAFSRLFASHYQILYDQSLDGRIRSDDPEYVNRAIREDYIVGSSATIVLCGAETWKRKYVDWEFRSTLHHEHALLGIALSTAARDSANRVTVAGRLHDNIATGYAHWITWTLDPTELRNAIEIAIEKSARTSAIENNRPRIARNLP